MYCPGSRGAVEKQGVASREVALWSGIAIPEGVGDQLAVRFGVLMPHLKERQRRLMPAAEARLLGQGGVRAVGRSTNGCGATNASVDGGPDSQRGLGLFSAELVAEGVHTRAGTPVITETSPAPIGEWTPGRGRSPSIPVTSPRSTSRTRGRGRGTSSPGSTSRAQRPGQPGGDGLRPQARGVDAPVPGHQARTG